MKKHGFLYKIRTIHGFDLSECHCLTQSADYNKKAFALDFCVEYRFYDTENSQLVYYLQIQNIWQ